MGKFDLHSSQLNLLALTLRLILVPSNHFKLLQVSQCGQRQWTQTVAFICACPWSRYSPFLDFISNYLKNDFAIGLCVFLLFVSVAIFFCPKICILPSKNLKNLHINSQNLLKICHFQNIFFKIYPCHSFLWHFYVTIFFKSQMNFQKKNSNSQISS